jgi:aminoglycoside phosphotransferase (APT) family kinase protein
LTRLEPTGFLDLVTLNGVLREKLPSTDDSPFTAELLSGGLSNLTFKISQGRRHWVLRRPPVGRVLATAHDMGREYRFLVGLRHTSVPTPAPYFFVDDSTIIGSPFYVMEYVPGQVVRNRADSAALTRSQRTLLSTTLIDTLTNLHRIDTKETGLSRAASAVAFFHRQVSRWWRQWEHSATRDLPDIERLYRSLADCRPREQRECVIHGDYRIDNTVIDRSGRIAAVLDWELATIGDPLTDLATLCIYWHDTGDIRRPMVRVASGITSQSGFGVRRDIVERYARASGADVTSFAPYIGLAAFKLAVILEGVHRRHLHNETIGQGFEGVADGVEPLIAIGLAALNGDWELAF